MGSIVAMSGCASMPEATIKYYLPKIKADITVNQTVRCIDTSNPIVETSVDFKPVYSANFEKVKAINLSELDTFYTSGSAEITLSKDGIIESFNNISTGGVSDTVTTFVSIVGALVALESTPIDRGVQAACKEINRVAGEKSGKPLPLSVVLKSNVTFLENQEIKTTPFRITQYPQSFYETIVPALGKLEYRIDTPEPNSIPVETTYNGLRAITLVEPSMVPVKVIQTSFVSNESTEYSAIIPVPQWGAEYNIPIPKPPMFGTNTLNLSLHKSGKIKTIKYGATNGAKELGTAFNALYDEIVETDAEKAAALKAEADVIAQQQRLLNCKTNPEECK